MNNRVPKPIVFTIFACALSFFRMGGACAQDFRQPIPITPELAAEALDPALMCVAIYTDGGVIGWQGPTNTLNGMALDDPASGFHAGVYERDANGHHQIALAFRGTDQKDINDWMTDFAQALGDLPEQYVLAWKAGQTLLAYSRQRGPEQAEYTFITGHSLGGGLASFCALSWKFTAYCFAAAPLGSSACAVIKDTNEIGLRSAPRWATHFFMEGDRVPDTARFLGDHFGRIVTPKLTFLTGSKADSGASTLRALKLAGFDLGKWAKAGKLINEIADTIARHSSVNYVRALVHCAQRGETGLALAGVWRSQGGFIGLAKSDTNFNFNLNGTVELNNEIKIFDSAVRVAERGRWQISKGVLIVFIPGFATLEYQLSTQLPDKAIEWKRSDVRPDENGFMRAARDRGESGQANAELLLLKGICHKMKGKIVTWFRADSPPF